jgi:hypothetical protein
MPTTGKRLFAKPAFFADSRHVSHGASRRAATGLSAVFMVGVKNFGKDGGGLEPFDFQ